MHDRKPKGHLKVGGVFLATLLIHVHTPLLFSPLSLSDIMSAEELLDVISHNNVKIHMFFQSLLMVSFKWENDMHKVFAVYKKCR